MQTAKQARNGHHSECCPRMIQFVKQNYKGLYAMSQWVANGRKGPIVSQPGKAAK